jgi:hypothetical protein
MSAAMGMAKRSAKQKFKLRHYPSRGVLGGPSTPETGKVRDCGGIVCYHSRRRLRRLRLRHRKGSAAAFEIVG